MDDILSSCPEEVIAPSTLFHATFTKAGNSQVIDYQPEIGSKAIVPGHIYGSDYNFYTNTNSDYLVTGGNLTKSGTSNKAAVWDVGVCGYSVEIDMPAQISARFAVRSPTVEGTKAIYFKLYVDATDINLAIYDRTGSRMQILSYLKSNYPVGTKIRFIDDGTSNANAFKVIFGTTVVLTSNLVDTARQTRFGIIFDAATGTTLAEVKVNPL